MLVPKLRFKEFKDEYKTYKLNDIVDFYKGNTLSKSDIKLNGNFPCILYGELYTKYNEITNKIISYTDRNDKNLFYSKINDVLIPCSGETALDISTSTCVLQNNVIIGGDLNVLRPKAQNGKYLSYLLSNKKKLVIAKYAQGDSIVHLYGEKIKNININLPTIEEQEKVSKLLEVLNRKIEIKKRKVETLKIYKMGLIKEVLNSSNKCKFGKLQTICQNLVSNITLSDIKSDTSTYKIYGATGAIGNMSKYTLNKPYIAIIKDGAGVGKSFICEPFSSFLSTLIGLIPQNCTIEYLKIVLDNINFSKYTVGSTIPHIYFKDFKNEIVKILPYDEQIKISNISNNINLKIDMSEQKLKLFQKMKKSLLQQMLI
ncbi:MAG: restriction endonuclease subunit S [Clostridia bacterium]|nr:restriction endonuclease subunit S [Clostridia bacterium]